MTADQLLQSRYQVIAPIPFLVCFEKDIFIIEKDGKAKIHLAASGLESEISTDIFFTEAQFDAYPDLFRKLHWAENRGVDDMPLYVKVNHKEDEDYHKDLLLENGTIFNVALWRYLTKGVEGVKEGFYFSRLVPKIGEPFHIHASQVIPATKEEYDEYIQTCRNENSQKAQAVISNQIASEHSDTLQNTEKREQLTLGQLIDLIDGVIKKYASPETDKETSKDIYVEYDFSCFSPTYVDSWRGSYNELAISYEQLPYAKNTKARDLLEILQSAVGFTFEGWKGGDFIMERDTPLWVANRGKVGSTAIVGIIDLKYKIIIETQYLDF